MLNFRKLKQEYSPAILKEGRALYEKKRVLSAKIIHLNPKVVRLSCRVVGGFDNTYECEIEIDRRESLTLDSDCDCPYKYDCQHLAAVLFYLEEHFDALLVEYSRNPESAGECDEGEKASLMEVFKEAETKEVARKGKKCQKELMLEYVGAAHVLGTSPFFIPEARLTEDKAELNIIYTPVIPSGTAEPHHFEIQLALRLPYRSKPLSIPHVKEFLDSVRYQEPIYIGTKRYYFVPSSFDADSAHLLKMILDFAVCSDSKDEKGMRAAQLSLESFGTLLADAYDLSCVQEVNNTRSSKSDPDTQNLPCLYCGSQEEPLRFSKVNAAMRFSMEYLEAPAPKILLQPMLILDGANSVSLKEVQLFECAKPGLIKDHIYYRFPSKIKRKHLRNLSTLQNVTIPEPLFGTFIENSLPEFLKYAELANYDSIKRFVTLPYTGNLQAECDLLYLNGELEAVLHFIYDNIKVPAALSQIKIAEILPFVTPQGILARNLTEEQNIISDLFQGFVYDPVQGVYSAKSEKKIVEFMTDVIPRNQNRVKFNCPENLSDQFVYDETHFELALRESERVDMYEVDLKTHGLLNGVTVDLLWDCLSSKKAYIEIIPKKNAKKKDDGSSPGCRPHKILVLDLERLTPVVQIFDEIGINRLDDHIELRPLWSLVNINAAHFKNLPIQFSMSKKLCEIQEQMLSSTPIAASSIPLSIKATLRSYQNEGIGWLERLRKMHLNGILADDMGLGKTLQAIIAITQHKEAFPDHISIVICPTSLVYNWKEEFSKFNPKLKVLPWTERPPNAKDFRRKSKRYDIIITSYSLLQKDIEFYKTISFAYAILDEAQHIKNRSTRNAKSVKMIQAAHRLILTGTPIENSLDELWSLFDFLMPGLLSTYERFGKICPQQWAKQSIKNLESLRRKVSPFILRRMKKDVLSELPPVTEIIYHCHLSEVQKELYHSYADSAREELSQLVKKEGFERVQIHVLATLTRLKQICCHPAIFAKDQVGSPAILRSMTC